MWWCISLILVLGRERQLGFCEYEATLVYIVNCRSYIVRPRLRVGKSEINPELSKLLFIIVFITGMETVN